MWEVWAEFQDDCQVCGRFEKVQDALLEAERQFWIGALFVQLKQV